MPQSSHVALRLSMWRWERERAERAVENYRAFLGGGGDDLADTALKGFCRQSCAER
jgi:hypothetical protein